MKKLITTAVLAASFVLPVHADTAASGLTLDQLLNNVKTSRAAEAKINAEREAAFTAVNADRKALVNQAEREHAEETTRGENLAQEFMEGERLLNQLENDLSNAVGNLGEMFGVVRQVSGDLAGGLNMSLISAEFPGRDAEIAAIAQAQELPTITELEELWIGLQTEMTQTAKVSEFTAPVINVDGETVDQTVTRVGAFNLMANGNYLQYNTETGKIIELGRQPESHKVATVRNFEGGNNGDVVELYVDPSRGPLLAIYTQKATLSEHIEHGGLVGKIILVMLVLGMLLALWRLVVLFIEGRKIDAQIKDMENPGDNALGRVIKAYHDNRNVDNETLELKVDEAILKESPRLEMGISLIKVMAAIAPMLGLLGTVTGMIATFQNITLFGTGDPKIMAGGISMALVTTVLGLVAALPLLLMHALVSSRAKAVQEVIDAQSTGLIAAHAEKGSK
ncbi:MotA/TolQ/ExbB proton channel family protein [Ferrimonas marina]|uniref:Biopolymer transport protein ExbB n=1 Tax=Ferrimonas marina TaxID=299255 RepID=A0A1M5YS79_9GAMM|nr:MotA/TolQ/ExbB proton channel family protein [Ferrimonas marina]SHI14779.1 biopolymer transport protein ExbB [Ferrimonas marina]